MHRSFKSMELVRHYLSTSIRDNADSLVKQVKYGIKEIAATVFAASLSPVITIVAKSRLLSGYPVWSKAALLVIIYMVGFALSYLTFRLIYNYVSHKMAVYRENKQPSYAERKKAIDNFDHIACDCVLISLEFINTFEEYQNHSEESEEPLPDEKGLEDPEEPLPDKTAPADAKEQEPKEEVLKSIEESLPSKSILVKTFDYYEILYYLKKAIEYTIPLTSDVDNYFRLSSGNTKGVDLFRIINIHSLMQQIHVFLDKHKDDISVPDALKPELSDQIKHILEQLNEIYDNCIGFLHDKYPDNYKDEKAAPKEVEETPADKKKKKPRFRIKFKNPWKKAKSENK